MTTSSKTSGVTRAERIAKDLAEKADDVRAEILAEVARALDIIDEDDHALVRTIISRIIGASTDTRLSFGYNIGRTLEGLARTSALTGDEWTDGERHDEPLLPWDESPARKYQNTRTRLTHAQISVAEINKEWGEAQGSGRTTMSDLTLGVVVDPRAWPYIPMLVKEGPAAFSRRLHVFLSKQAREGISGDTLTTSFIIPAGQIATQAVKLNGLGFPHSAVQAWRAKVPLPDGKKFAAAAETSRPPIPREVVRRTMRPWLRELERKTKGGTYVATRGAFRELRAFCFISMMLVTGSRIDALRQCRIKDYEEEHRFPDGTIGPAIGLHVGKKKQKAVKVRWKGLPPALAPYITLYMQAANIAYQPDGWPLWAAGKYKPHAPEDPDLIPAPWNAHEQIVGSKSAHLRVLKSEQKKLAQKMLDEGASAEEVRVALAEMPAPTSGRAVFPIPNGKGLWDGYRSHSLRKFANNAIAQAAEVFLATDAGAEFRGAITPFAVAKSILDHEVGEEDRLGYGLAKSVENRELWSMRICSLVFDLVAGDLGAPQGIDEERVRALRAERRALLQREEDIHKMLSRTAQDAAQQRADAQAELAKKPPASVKKMSTAEVLAWFAQRSSQVAQAVAEIEARAETHRADLHRQLRTLSKQMRAKEGEILVAETTQVPLPEAEELSWTPGRVKLRTADEIEPDVDDDLEDDVATLVPVRSRLWPEEMASLLDVSLVQLRRWMNPDYLAGTKRTENVPWTAADLERDDPDLGPVVITESVRRRFINAKRIDRTKLTAHQEQQLTVLLAQPLAERTRRS